jgi:pre-mRNA-splicing factor SYF1
MNEDDRLAESVKFNFKFWWAKLDAITEKSFNDRTVMYNRALRHLPGSYKLWYHFLREHIANCKDKCVISASYTRANQTFEKCLIYMHKMPRIWIMYLEFLFDQKLFNKFRVTFDEVNPTKEEYQRSAIDPALQNLGSGI